MRIGAPIFESYHSPEAWVAICKKHGYRAAYAPIDLGASDSEIMEYRAAAAENDIVIAEVSAFLNHPFHPDPQIASQALRNTIDRMVFADELGAGCCVNVSSSRGLVWDGPHPLNLTEETFAMTVRFVRKVLEEADPHDSGYALEFMPWMYPVTVDDHLRLLQEVNHPRFVVHFDPVNMINSPEKYYSNGAIIRDCFQRLGDKLVGIHCKDILLREKLTTHLDEVVVGEGYLDHRTLIQCVETLKPNCPVMMEHLATPQLYDKAVAYIRELAESMGYTT